MTSKLIFGAECRTNNGHGFNSHSTTRHFSVFLAIAQACFLDSDNLYLPTNLISRIPLISKYHIDNIFFMRINTVNQVQQQTCSLFHKSSSADELQGMVLFGQSSFKCLFRSFLCNSLPQFLGHNTSAKSHSFK